MIKGEVKIKVRQRILRFPSTFVSQGNFRGIQYLNVRSRDNENLFTEKLSFASWFSSWLNEANSLQKNCFALLFSISSVKLLYICRATFYKDTIRGYASEYTRETECLSQFVLLLQ